MEPRSKRSAPSPAAAADPRGAGIKVALIAGLMTLAVTALVFSGSFATSDVADDGLAALHGQSALGANDLAFKALGQLVLLAEDRELGVADDAVVEQAATEARQAIEHLAARVDALGAVDPAARRALQQSLDEVVATASEVFAAVDAGNAAEVLAETAKPAFETLRDALATGRDERAEALQLAGDVAGRMGLVSRFLVAFVLPLGAILAYRFTARRQLALAEVQLDARLAAEQEVHRAKDEFIANMSHELRTPLTSIYGFSEMLIEDGLVDPETALELIGLINGESAELGRMVEDLLVSARSAAGALSYSYEPVDLAHEAALVASPLSRAGATIEVVLPEAHVWADPLRARQLLRNLISNAARHGGSEVRVSGEVEQGRLVVRVADDGNGVPEEMVPRLFTRFVHDGREALTTGSVGLGLAVVKELVSEMGGDVTYRRSGETVFEFWLPLARTRAGEPAPSIAADPYADVA